MDMETTVASYLRIDISISIPKCIMQHVECVLKKCIVRRHKREKDETKKKLERDFSQPNDLLGGSETDV